MPNPFVLDSTLARRIWYYDSTGGTPETVANIVISEIMPNPSAVSDGNGEWFEVFNADSIIIDLNSWVIKDNDSDSPNYNTISVATSLNIEPGEYLVLGNNADSTTNGGLFVDYEYSGFYLGNFEDEIILLDSTQNIVDQVFYTTEFPFGNGISMYLSEITADNNAPNWVASTNCLETAIWALRAGRGMTPL